MGPGARPPMPGPGYPGHPGMPATSHHPGMPPNAPNQAPSDSGPGRGMPYEAQPSPVRADNFDYR